MNTDTDIWIAFARTFGMLFVVLAFFILVFYLFRRFSGAGRIPGSQALIRVMAVHHLAPKEKLVLVSVKDKAVLVGVTPSGMSQLAVLDHDPDTEAEKSDRTLDSARPFSQTLGAAMKQWTGRGSGQGAGHE